MFPIAGGAAKRLSVGALVVIASHISRLISQALFFLCFARAMGPEILGVFAGAIALCVIAAPFIGFGAGSLLIKECHSSKRNVSDYLGNAYSMHLVSLLVAFPLLYGIHRLYSFSPIAGLLFIAVFAAELLFGKLVEICAQVYQAHDRIIRMAQQTIVFGVSRIAAIAAVLLSDSQDSLECWLASYVLSAAVSASISVAMVAIEVGAPSPCFKLGQVKEGLLFSVGISSQGVYNDADKTLMLRYQPAVVAGNYSTAYKVVDIAFAPVRAVLATTYTGFFKAGKEGPFAAFSYARRLLPVSLGLGAIGSIGLFACAELAAGILGEEYRASTGMLRYLSVIPLFRAFHYVFADCLTGSDKQELRCTLQVAVAVLNVMLGVALIPRYSWAAAALISIACDLLLCALMFFAAYSMASRNKRSDSFQYES